LSPAPNAGSLGEAFPLRTAWYRSLGGRVV